MASAASQLIEEDTAHAQRDSLEDAREICADGTCFPNNLRKLRVGLVSNVKVMDCFTHLYTPWLWAKEDQNIYIYVY